MIALATGNVNRQQVPIYTHIADLTSYLNAQSLEIKASLDGTASLYTTAISAFLGNRSQSPIRLFGVEAIRAGVIRCNSDRLTSVYGNKPGWCLLYPGVIRIWITSGRM